MIKATDESTLKSAKSPEGNNYFEQNTTQTLLVPSTGKGMLIWFSSDTKTRGPWLPSIVDKVLYLFNHKIGAPDTPDDEFRITNDDESKVFGKVVYFGKTGKNFPTEGAGV